MPKPDYPSCKHLCSHAAGLAGAAALSALLALGAPSSHASTSTGLRQEVNLPPIPTTFPPLPDLRAPNIEQAVLPNGLRIFMVEDHEVPLVKASLVMRGGMRASPPDKVLCGPLMHPLTWAASLDGRADGELQASSSVVIALPMICACRPYSCSLITMYNTLAVCVPGS